MAADVRLVCEMYQYGRVEAFLRRIWLENRGLNMSFADKTRLSIETVWEYASAEVVGLPITDKLSKHGST